MRAGGEEVRVPCVGDLADGGSSTFYSPPLVVDFSSSVQLPVSHEALSVGEHLPAKIALVVLLTRVYSQMLGEVERLTEHLATDVTRVRLFPCVDTVVSPQSLRPPEAFATYLTSIRPFRSVAWRCWAPPPPDDGIGIPFLSGLPRPPGLCVRLAGVGQRHGGTIQGGGG